MCMHVGIKLYRLCSSKTRSERIFLPQAALQNATRQLTLSLDSTGRDGNVRTPVTLTPSGKVYYCSPEDWRSGFYAGSLWYLYELTADTAC